MSALERLRDEAGFALDHAFDLLRATGTPTIRLGVTGLSRAGKTVFISALVHNLLHGGRLPLFKPFAEGRLAGARLSPQPDDAVPRFAYEDHVRTMIEERLWPHSTRMVSELRVVVSYESASTLKRTIGKGRINLDIVDYPGEWLLDLALLSKSYATWSAETIDKARQSSRAALSRDWLSLLDATAPGDAPDEARVRALAEAFTAYLRAARDDRHALSMLPPGRFLMPGDLEGSPALTFSPLEVVEPSERGSLGAMMERRFEAYKSHVVKPFFREHFARLDRQIVLVDMLAALNAGPDALRDLETALADVLSAFRPGRATWLSAILSRRIDRILFAATKADHVHHTDHDKLARLLDRLVRDAAERASFAGADAQTIAMAAVRATKEAHVTHGGERLPVLVGTPLEGERIAGDVYDGATDVALFPGDLPSEPSQALDPEQRGDEALRYLRFRPPELERTGDGVTLSLPHIRLDRALQFLLGDVLA